MLKVSLSDVKPIVKRSISKSFAKSEAKNSVKSVASKAIPSVILLGNGIYALNVLKTENKPKYEPCSDFCGEIFG